MSHSYNRTRKERRRKLLEDPEKRRIYWQIKRGHLPRLFMVIARPRKLIRQWVKDLVLGGHYETKDTGRKGFTITAIKSTFRELTK